ncbi:L-dopachrome tautomerase-related protein [uncultured Hyphomonas sp.]|uniref:L-dopachrome tautomerase-related protein n=1 Tax=uncultured Hyphomonas sp. TaxID=225298 RepID=UPI0037482A12
MNGKLEMIRSMTLAAAIAGVAVAFSASAQQKLDVVADLTGAMPTGVTVSPDGRIFLNYPQWGDNPEFAVGELRDGQVTAYPDLETNRAGVDDPDRHFVSVQSVVADGDNRLWVLDTGAPGFQEPVPGGAKLVAIDLAENKIAKTIILGPDVVLPTTYLNDVRFDLRQGEAGVAYITDSSIHGPGGIIVVDLASGSAMRRLSGHPTTMPDPGFRPTIEGEVLMNRPKGQAASPWLVGTDGIAISPDGDTLYYCALSSRHFYAVPTAMLRDANLSDEEIAAGIRDLGPKAPSDGLAEDSAGNIYAGDYENGTIRRFRDGEWQTISADPQILWPDTLSVGPDGWLYFTANQLHRQPGFHEGVDLRQQPYQLLRIQIGESPVFLTDEAGQ